MAWKNSETGWKEMSEFNDLLDVDSFLDDDDDDDNFLKMILNIGLTWNPMKPAVKKHITHRG